MLTYIVFILRFGWTEAADVPVGYELGWAVFLLVQIVLSIALHSATLYITVMAAYIRYVAISTMTKNWCDRDVPWTRIAAIVGTVFTLCIPTCLLHSIVAVSDDSDTSMATYTIVLEGYGDLAVYTCELFKFNLWLTGIVFKIIPCCLLVLFTSLLLHTLSRNRKQRLVLLPLSQRRTSVHLQRDGRITKMLVVVLLVFVCTELPQGMVSVLNALFPNDIHFFVYTNFGELLDLLSLINSNACFIIYASEGIMVPTIEHLAHDAIRGKRVLDIGCGDGYLLNHYIRWGAKEVVAIDGNAEAIKICYFEQDDLRMDRRIDFRFIDPRAMNFQSEFDVAMAIFVLQFAETAEDLQKILHNTAKALKTGGQLFGYVPNGVSDLNTTSEEGEMLGAMWSFSGQHPLDGEVGKVRLYGHQHDTVFEEPITFFYRGTYERLLKHAGFHRIEWFSPCPSKDAEKEYGAEVLNHFLHPPKDIMFRAVKR